MLVSDLAIKFWSKSDSFYFFVFPFTVVDLLLIAYNRIGGVMVSVLDTHVVDHGFKFKSGKTRVNAFFLLSIFPHNC